MCSATPAGHLCTVRRSIDWVDAHPCRTRRMAHGWVEKLEQGPEKSGCFYGLLRWSVGRHWLLRSQCTYSRQRTRIRQSAFMLIAFGAAVNKSGNGVAMIQTTQPKRMHHVSPDLDGNIVVSCFQVVCFSDDVTTK